MASGLEIAGVIVVWIAAIFSVINLYLDVNSRSTCSRYLREIQRENADFREEANATLIAAKDMLKTASAVLDEVRARQAAASHVPKTSPSRHTSIPVPVSSMASLGTSKLLFEEKAAPENKE